MRINKFIAQATGLSRRTVDQAIQAGRVQINGQTATTGNTVTAGDQITLDGQAITPAVKTTLMLNKPVDYVCSRRGQGSTTIYDLLPLKYHQLKPVGRLDKDSSGLLLLTNDGDLANQLTHPRYAKIKLYEISLNKPLEPLHQQIITDRGIMLEDGPSRLSLSKLEDTGLKWQVTMREGRNRQIRRTFAALGYQVSALHRIRFGDYALGNLRPGSWSLI